MRLPTFKELRRYVEIEGWENKDKQSKKKQGDHYRYVFTTPGGERLFTRVSHGNGQIYDQDLFARILRDQLRIDENQFWAAVDKGLKPRRPSPVSISQENGLDAKLARNLISKVGLNPTQLIGMSQEEAVAKWQRWLNSDEP